MRVRKAARPSKAGTKDLLSSWLDARPDLDLSVFLLGIVMNRIGRMLDASFDRMCRSEFGISAPDMRVLFALRRHGAPYALRPTDLFRALLVTSGAITKQVDRLQSLGLVERVTDSEYVGGFKVHLTKKGVRVANKATDVQVQHSLLGEAMKSIPKNLQAAGEKFVYRLLDGLEREAGKEQSTPGIWQQAPDRIQPDAEAQS